MTNTAKQQPVLFLTTAEVMKRYRINSTATLWQWRKKLGFPQPVNNGRFYNISALEKWDQRQLEASND